MQWEGKMRLGHHNQRNPKKRAKKSKLLPINLSMNCVWKRNGSFRRPVRNTSIRLSGFMKALGGNNLILFLGYLFLCARYDDDIYSKSYISCGKEGKRRGKVKWMEKKLIYLVKISYLAITLSTRLLLSRCYFLPFHHDLAMIVKRKLLPLLTLLVSLSALTPHIVGTMHKFYVSSLAFSTYMFARSLLVLVGLFSLVWELKNMLNILFTANRLRHGNLRSGSSGTGG